MFNVNNKDVLPEIFFSAHKFFEQVSNSIASLNSDVINDNLVAYLNHGWLYLKSALGDLCVGVKALGDKLGVLGGNSFAGLKEQSDALVPQTGNLFNMVAGYNPENGADELLQNTKDYVNFFANALKEISTATTHLYGDAKNRLGDQFESMEQAMVSFFRMAKVKIVGALIDAQIATAYALQYFGIENDLTQENLLNPDQTLNKPACQQLVVALVVDFDDAKNLALKMFN